MQNKHAEDNEWEMVAELDNFEEIKPSAWDVVEQEMDKEKGTPMRLTITYDMDEPGEARSAELAVKSRGLALAIYETLEDTRRTMKYNDDEAEVQKATSVFLRLSNILSVSSCEFLHEPLWTGTR